MYSHQHSNLFLREAGGKRGDPLDGMWLSSPMVDGNRNIVGADTSLRETLFKEPQEPQRIENTSGRSLFHALQVRGRDERNTKTCRASKRRDGHYSCDETYIFV